MPEDRKLEGPKTSNLFWDFIGNALRKVIPEGNPFLNQRIGDIREWIIEFDDKGIPIREVALDDNDQPIAKLPWKNDYGYWTDNNLVKADFTNHFKVLEIEREVFQNYWNALE